MAKLTGVKVIDMKDGQVTKVAWEGAEYVKVDGKISEERRAGDIFMNGYKHPKLTLGAFYEVRDDVAFAPNILDDKDGPHSNAFYSGDSTLFRKQSANTPTLEERVSTLETKVDALGVDAPTYKLVTDRKPRVGDFVKYAEFDYSFITAGKYYEITEIKGDGDYWFLDNDNDPCYTEEHEEYAVYERVQVGVAQAPEPLKIGDYAKVVQRVNEFDEGNIVKIVGKKGDGSVNRFDFKVDFVKVTGKSKFSGQTSGYINADNIVKATDEEVVQAKRQAEEKAVADKWAEIGRKPNEFKVGDIFRGTDGNIYEVSEIRVNSDHPTRFINKRGRNDGYMANAPLTLITPVEARFDR